MKKFDAVVFDMDGVIFDSERAIMNCWIEVASKWGLESMKENFHACIGVNIQKTKEIMLAAYGDSFPFEEFDKEASALFHETYDGGRLPVKKGVRVLLDYLRRSGKKIALASSTKKKSVINRLSEAEILEYFDEIITGDMVAHSKPHPEIYLFACEKIGVEPKDAYAIEDSYNGVRSASSGGLRTIMVPDLLPSNNEMKELAEIVLDDLEEVVKYLNE